MKILCARCNDRDAVMLLGKGIFVCNLCYQSPEDQIRDVSRDDPVRVALHNRDRAANGLPPLHVLRYEGYEG